MTRKRRRVASGIALALNAAFDRRINLHLPQDSLGFLLSAEGYVHYALLCTAVSMHLATNNAPNLYLHAYKLCEGVVKSMDVSLANGPGYVVWYKHIIYYQLV